MTNPYYNATGNPPSQTRGISLPIRNEFLLIQNAFAMIASSQGYISGIDVGAANTYVVNPTPAIISLSKFSVLAMLVGGSNGSTGASTVTVSGLGPYNIVRRDGTAIQQGDIPASSIVELYFDGTNFQLQGNALIGNATGAINFKQATAIASASTINLDNANGNSGQITGTTTINTVTLGAGKIFFGTFAGSLQLTNGANLLLPGAQNITTQAGDMAFFVGLGGGITTVFFLALSGYAQKQAWQEILSTTFSGVALVSQLSLFTTQFDSYQIELANFSGDNTGMLQLQLASAGTLITSTNYSYAGNTTLTSGGVTGFGAAGTSQFILTQTFPGSSTANLCGAIEVYNTSSTSGTGHGISARLGYATNTPNFHSDVGNGMLATGSGVSGFKLFLSSGGNMTGKIKVYGKQA